jgi:hypothetical protein
MAKCPETAHEITVLDISLMLRMGILLSAESSRIVDLKIRKHTLALKEMEDDFMRKHK